MFGLPEKFVHKQPEPLSGKLLDIVYTECRYFADWW